MNHLHLFRRPRTASVSSVPQRVVACYSVLDSFMRDWGFTDLTEGMYEGDPARHYEEAQPRQAESLLDRAGCRANTRLLDIGCGYGRILKAAQARGAKAVGITLSPEQVRYCQAMGLDVRLQDYRSLAKQREGQFDAVIANGSIEHFVQVVDAVNRREEAIYREMFEIVHRMLGRGTRGHFVTTVIHFRERPDPVSLLSRASHFATGSPEFHWARLTRSFGGWYPVPGQLEHCAQGYFQLIDEEDGTEDYRRTSDDGLRMVRQRMRSMRYWKQWLRTIARFVRRPIQSTRMKRCLFGSESWNWQFRGAEPPARLLRHTWRRIG